MSLNLGIIEWVNNTKPIKSCIESQEPNIRKWRSVRDSYNSWIVRHAPRSKNIAGKFHMLILTTTHFLKCVFSSSLCCLC